MKFNLGHSLVSSESCESSETDIIVTEDDELDFVGLESSEVDDIEVKVDYSPYADTTTYTGTARLLFFCLFLIFTCYVLYLLYGIRPIQNLDVYKALQKFLKENLSVSIPSAVPIEVDEDAHNATDSAAKSGKDVISNLEDADACIASIERDLNGNDDSDDEDFGKEHQHKSRADLKDLRLLEACVQRSAACLTYLVKNLNEEGPLMLHHHLERIQDMLSRTQAILSCIGGLVMADSQNNTRQACAGLKDYLRGATLLNSIGTRLDAKLRKGQEKVQACLKSTTSRLRFCVEKLEESLGNPNINLDFMLPHTCMLRVFQEREKFPDKLVTRNGEHTVDSLEDLLKRALEFVLKRLNEDEANKVAQACEWAKAGGGLLGITSSNYDSEIRKEKTSNQSNAAAASATGYSELVSSPSSVKSEGGARSAAGGGGSPEIIKKKYAKDDGTSNVSPSLSTTPKISDSKLSQENRLPESESSFHSQSSNVIVFPSENGEKEITITSKLEEKIQHNNMIGLGAMHLSRLDLIDRKLVASKEKAEEAYEADERMLRDTRAAQHSTFMSNGLQVGTISAAADALKKRRTNDFEKDLAWRVNLDFFVFSTVAAMSILAYCISLYGCHNDVSLLSRINAQVNIVCMYMAESSVPLEEAAASIGSVTVEPSEWFGSITSGMSSMYSSATGILTNSLGMGKVFKWFMTTKLMCLVRLLVYSFFPILFSKLLSFILPIWVVRWFLPLSVYYKLMEPIHSAFWFLKPFWIMLFLQGLTCAVIFYFDQRLYWYLPSGDNIRNAALILYVAFCLIFSLILGSGVSVASYSKGVQIGYAHGYQELLSMSIASMNRCMSKFS